MSKKIEKLTVQANTMVQNALHNHQEYEFFGDVFYFYNNKMILYTNAREMSVFNSKKGFFYPQKFKMDNTTYKMLRRELLRNKVKNFALNKLPAYSAAATIAVLALIASGLIFPKHTQFLKLHKSCPKIVRTHSAHSTTDSNNTYYMNNENER